MNTRIEAVTTALLGTVVAGAGWLVTHFVDDSVSVPVLEYRLRHGSKADPDFDCPFSRTEITLYNLSRQKKFKELTFLLFFNEGEGTFNELSKMVPTPPAYPPTRSGPPASFGNTFTYPRTAIHPQTELRLLGCYESKTHPTFHVTQESEAVRLVERGGLTWLIRHEFGVAIALLLLWTGFVIFYVFRIKKRGETQ